MKPRIGIRATIDGRRLGIRESLEETCGKMAKAAAEIIEKNCFYSDGTPAECVIYPGTIGGNGEARECVEYFSDKNVTATLTVTPCWCYGLETMDTDPKTIKAVWGFNGTERPGAVYLAAVMAAHAQLGLPAFAIYGEEVQEPNFTAVTDDVKNKIINFAQCALAAGQMKGNAYVGIGGVSMGIAGSIQPDDFFRKYLGMRSEHLDMSEVQRRLKKNIFDQEEYKKALEFADKFKLGFNKNEKPLGKKEEREAFETSVKMALIFRDIVCGNEKLREMGYGEEASGRGGVMGGFQGQRQWTDFMPNGDFAEGILNSGFDWNGKREPLTFATENDALNGVSMHLGRLITGGAAVFADVRTYWSSESVKKATGITPTGKASNGFIHLINSGAAALDGCGESKDEKGNPVIKKWWELNEKDIKSCIDACELSPADLLYFRGGGYSTRFTTRQEMPVTLIRVNMVEGVGPMLQIAEGYTLALPEEMSDKIWKRTDYTWPSTYFAPNLTGKGAFTSVYKVMSAWGANHGAFVYGHVGAKLITLASMLRIPVPMHNVAEEDIFRPHSWNAFGTNDLEGADMRACAAYGPLYK